MKILFRFLCTLLIAGSLVLSQLACDSKTKKAANLTYQFSGLVVDLAKAADRGYEAGLFTLAQKDRAVVIIRKMNAGAIAARKVVQEIAQMPTPPADKIALLNTIVSQQMVDPFLQLLSDWGAAAQSDILRTTITAIRVALLGITGIFGAYISPQLEDGLRRLKHWHFEQIVDSNKGVIYAV